MYLAIEGIDRAGKSTQIELLKERFPDALFTKEPGGTPLGRRIRTLILDGEDPPSPLAELFLFLADRNHHVERVIKPNRGRLIISDRSFISGIAYAQIRSPLELEDLFRLNGMAVEGIYPDRVVLLHLSPEELRRRLKEGERDTIEERGADYLLRVQESLKEILFKSGIKCTIIDATKPVEEIHREIIAFIEKGT
ncbi:MAG: dTMP kinase [Epsilonproteobacteria bacterium]|nr:dTMP kinase [Campylobacterota bacterium]NPA57462.1 dTMP kinase [Campylobacterota bacterium]